MLAERELRQALAAVSAVPLHGPFNRFVPFDAMVSPRSLRFLGAASPSLTAGIDESGEPYFVWEDAAPSPRPLWGIGSIKNGGRYNKPETFEVIYLAEDPITALAEVNLVFSSNPALGKIKGPPMVHIAVDGILESVVDITLPDAQSALATSHQELTGAWLWEQAQTGEAPTQRLGRVAFESERLCGLRYPSSKNPGGVCVAVFPDRLTGGSYVQVFDPFDNLAQRIPPNPSTPQL
jgi:RES domain-containing protein